MPYLIPDLPLITSDLNGITDDQYVVFEEVIKRSRFITCVFHADSREGVLSFADAARSVFPNATHYCWAYAAGAPGDTAKIGQNDDGEPHGTAGRPMLNQLLHCGMGEIAAVTVRYFGGVKLGTGGLSRAYMNGVKEALGSVSPIQKRIFKKGTVAVDYALLNRVQEMLLRSGGKILGQDYAERAELTVELPEEQVAAFVSFSRSSGTSVSVMFG